MSHHAKQLFKFGLSGGMGTILDISSFSYMISQTEISKYTATVISSFIGMTFVFFVNKFFTFKNHERRYLAQALKFYTVYGVSFCLNVLITWGLFWTGLHPQIAKLLAIAIMAMWNYVFSHMFIFRSRNA